MVVSLVTVMGSGNHLKEIILHIAKSKVEFVICGGVAAVLHGVERMTLDLDLSLAMKTSNLQLFLDIMKELKLSPRAPVPPEVLLDPEKVRIIVEEKNALVFTFLDPDDPVRQVDVFLAPDMDFEGLRKDAVNIILDEVQIPVVSIKKLIEMKLAVRPPRDKDVFDLKILRKLNEQHEDNR